MRILLVAISLLASACFSAQDAGECNTDSQCGDGFSCTRTAECVEIARLSSTRLTWTINGITPSPADSTACNGIGELEVDFDDSLNGLGTGFAPVPCANGQVYYDKMPPRFDSVTLVAKDNAGRRLTSESAVLREGENVVALDLRP